MAGGNASDALPSHAAKAELLLNREYQVEHSAELGRPMERLVFGHGGLPIIVFPTSCSRFYQFEDEGMVAAIADKIDRGEVQLFCVDSVDSESWYARSVEGRWRIARHLQYERYIMNEVIPGIRARNGNPQLAMAGCSFGGFHAMTMALRHPDVITGVLSMSGAFEIGRFLRGHYDEDSYLCVADSLSAESGGRVGISTGIAAALMCWRRASTTSAGTITNDLPGSCVQRGFR